MRYPVLIYHGISDATETVGKYLLPKEKLARHVQLIKALGVRYLGVGDILAAHSRVIADIPQVMITFDDGHVDNFTRAFPILLSHQIPGTFFVISDRIGQSGYMQWGELKEMINAGMSIQSHTATHRYLSLLTREETKQELIRSKKTIEDRLSIPVDCLSLPYGDGSRRILEQALQLGYKRIFTSTASYATPEEIIIPRINIWGSISEKNFSKIIKCNHSIRLQLRSVQLIKSLVKNVLRKVNLS